jgi:Arc/MetJ-type ribon-helix-helix transcriptional regulator
MTINLPEDLERSLRAEVQSGRFASMDDAMAEAVRRFLGQLQPGSTEAPRPAASDEELQRRLFEAGLLSEIKPAVRVATGTEAFPPIPIQGEPLSETVIRERR